MVQRRSQGIGAAAIPLIHTDYVHAQGQALGGDPQHVIRFARPLQAVDENCRQRVPAIALPVAMGENFNAWLYFDQPSLGSRQRDVARENEVDQSLPMPPAQAPSRQEDRRFRLPSLHPLILNGVGS